jgi:DNA (cytosine-5)-methyltransferase 1
MRTAWFAEVDPYASAVLKKHWPEVPNHGDVRSIRAESVEHPDVLCGGFPCQDISNAGKRAGIDGERSGLWSEYARIIGELRPRYVVVENVAALLGRGIERVLGDLAALGFDAEWHCIPASAVGAPHRRDRVWIVAYADERRMHRGCADAGDGGAVPAEGLKRVICGGSGGAHVADADELARDEGRTGDATQRIGGRHADRGIVRAHISDAPLLQRIAVERFKQDGIARGRWNEERWFVESGMGRVSDGVRNRVDRLRCLGNAIVPQIAEIIGRAIVRAA